MQRKSSTIWETMKFPMRLCPLSPTHTHTPSTATRSGQKLSDVRTDENLWLGYADGAGGDGAVTGCTVQARASVAGLGQADVRHDDGFGKGKMACGGGHPAAGTATSPQAATLGPYGGVLAGLSVSGGLCVALPCAAAKRSRLLP